MNDQPVGWVEILAHQDFEALWNKLFRLVSRHSSVRNLFNSDRTARARLQDLNTDITQDLFLKLHRKGRWQHYVDADYPDETIEHELYHIEIPNLVSLMLRQRHPEAYRLARRISILIQSQPEFRRYRSLASARSAGEGKLTTRVFGLKEWPDDKPAKPYQNMEGLLKDVAYRGRDRRRAGRSGETHIIISNPELAVLLVEIFRAVDSPLDIRIIRSLALSKLPVEDSRFVSIDAALTVDGVPEPEPLNVDLPDERPTPEQQLLESESNQQAEVIAQELLAKMQAVVSYKPRRYSRLARVAWHCYFDSSSPSQTAIARMIGISNSLVSHYRKLFDTIIGDVQLGAGQYIPFLHAFSLTLEMSISTNGAEVVEDKAGRSADKSTYRRYPLTMAAAGSAL